MASCRMKINAIQRLAFSTKVSELEGDTITRAPLSNFPHIRDLVTDFCTFLIITRIYIYNEYADIKLEEVEIMGKEDTGNANTKLLTEFKQTPEEVDKYLQFSYCIKCGLCYSACPTTGADLKFPGPQALAQMYRYVADNRDHAIKERLDGILCHILLSSGDISRL